MAFFKKFNSINTYFALNLYSSSPAAENIEVASAAANGAGNADSTYGFGQLPVGPTSCFGPISGF